MSKFELSDAELLRRVENGDEMAEIALEYRIKGKKALLDDLRASESERRMEEQMMHGCD